MVRWRCVIAALSVTLMAAPEAQGQSGVLFESPVRLLDLVSGISISKRERLRIQDIRIGHTSIRDRFLEVDAQRVSSWAYYLGFDESVTLKLRDKASLENLRELMLPRGQTSFITVNLVDPRRGLLRSFYEEFDTALPDVRFSLTVKIPIFDPCDRLTQIIFYGIDSTLKTEVKKAGQTEAQITLESVFEKVINDRVEPFMERLDPIDRSNSCFTTFTLLKWLRNEKVHGFEFEEYRLNDELKTILTTIANSLASIHEWQLYKLQLSVIGYTDSVDVDGIPLAGSMSGVDSLEKHSAPLEIFYDGCSVDQLRGEGPQFVGYLAPAGRPVRSPLKDNCELGAVRAYVAAAFMAESLRGQDIEYEYATGGISTLDTDEDSLKRMIDLKIVVKAAKSAEK